MFSERSTRLLHLGLFSRGLGLSNHSIPLLKKQSCIRTGGVDRPGFVLVCKFYTAALCDLMALDHGQGVQCRPLLVLGVDLVDQWLQVRDVL